MKFLKHSAMAAAATALVLAASAAQAFPNGPIEFVIPFGAGGSADIEGRLLGKEMSNVLGVPVTPVNRPGGGGAISYTHTKNAKPDGQTVVWSSTSILTTTNLGNMDYDYDALDHIGRVEYQPQPFVVLAKSPWKTFGDFVKACKANQGKFKIANSGTGSATHAQSIALMDVAGCKVIHLPKGIAGRNKSVLNGEADAMIAPLTTTVNLTKSGKLRVLAMTSAARSEVMPEVPTAKELGYDAELVLFRGLSVPKGTPAAVKDKLADAMIKAAKSPAFMAMAKKSGFTIAPMGHEEFSAYLAQEDKKVKAIFKAAGLYRSKSKSK